MDFLVYDFGRIILIMGVLTCLQAPNKNQLYIWLVVSFYPAVSCDLYAWNHDFINFQVEQNTICCQSAL